MSSSTSENTPTFPFPFPSFKDWLKIASQELDGADPMEKLKSHKGNLEILPFYCAPSDDHEINIRLKPSPDPYYGARSWINAPRILISKEKDANEIALAYLNSGADGILFDCRSDEINITALLDKIDLAHCSVFFLVDKAGDKWLQNYFSFAQKDFPNKEISGGVFWRNNPPHAYETMKRFDQWPKFHAIGIVVPSQNLASDEVADSLFQAVQLIHSCTDRGMHADLIINQLSFSVSMGTDFFLEIAKIKSLRNLWHQVAAAYGAANPAPLHIHATSKAWVNESHQPHSSMIKSTTAAMAAIAGGCNSLTIEPEGEADAMMGRVARNVSSILREESHFSKVADPTAGSYFIDLLVHQLSEKAWATFQSRTKA